MGEGRLILVCGGSRSGKSEFAEELAAGLGGQVIYVATSQVCDEEMAQRVAAHRSRRPAEWETIEEPVAVAKHLEERGQKDTVFLIDCLTLFITNLFLEEGLQAVSVSERQEAILAEVEKLAKTAREIQGTVIVVTNEIGMGVVPESSLGREFRDLAGKANQIMARYAQEVYFTLLGIPIELKALNRMNEREMTRMKGGQA